MSQLERATPADFERVYPLLERFNNPAITREMWRGLFDYTWPCADDTRGFMLVDEGRVVGFFAAILSERRIDGRLEKFANLSSWITLPEYRAHALMLLQACSSLEGRTIFCLSPRKDLLPIYQRFGYSELETGALILYPIPGFENPGTWLRFRSTTDTRKIAKLLSDEDRAILEHHLPHPCRHLLIYDGAEYCHIVFNRTKGRRFHFANVHHIGNVLLFLKALDVVRWRLALAAGAPFVMIESRFLPESFSPRFSRRISFAATQVYKSETLKPSQIDGLYTETILLGL
jgi:hypothetical protein